MFRHDREAWGTGGGGSGQGWAAVPRAGEAEVLRGPATTATSLPARAGGGPPGGSPEDPAVDPDRTHSYRKRPTRARRWRGARWWEQA